jgi:hypothetical protein
MNKTGIKAINIKDMQTGCTIDSFQNMIPARKKVDELNKMAGCKRYRLIVLEGGHGLTQNKGGYHEEL